MTAFQKFLGKPYLYILIILIGSGLKFYKLDQQFFWDDEVATILHTSGISMAEYGSALPVNQIVGKDHYMDILALNEGKFSIFEQIIGLTKMPQLTPGHYYYLIFWTRIFGDGYMSFRFFSVIVYLLALPFLFLLARKIFDSDLAAWITLSFYSVSPFIQIYAQESRYYILWAAAMAIFHYVFLMAMEKNTRRWWIIYIITGFFFIHITILNFFILFLQGLYYLRFSSKNWKPLIISCSLIFLSSLPWLIYIYINRADIQGALSWQIGDHFGKHSFSRLLGMHLEGSIDLFMQLSASGWLGVASLWLTGLSLLAASIAMIVKGKRSERFFVLLFTFAGILIFLLVDELRESFTSFLTRYHLLYYLGFFLLMGWAFKELYQRNVYVFSLLFLLLIGGGIYSSKVRADRLCAKKRFDCRTHISDARDFFSGDERILIISDYTLLGKGQYSMMMSLLLACENEHMDICYARGDYPDFRSLVSQGNYDKIYAMYLSEELQSALEEEFAGVEMMMVRDKTFIGQFHLPMFGIEPGKLP